MLDPALVFIHSSASLVSRRPVLFAVGPAANSASPAIVAIPPPLVLILRNVIDACVEGFFFRHGVFLSSASAAYAAAQIPRRSFGPAKLRS
jgi:hypothetical protein